HPGSVSKLPDVRVSRSGGRAQADKRASRTRPASAGRKCVMSQGGSRAVRGDERPVWVTRAQRAREGPNIGLLYHALGVAVDDTAIGRAGDIGLIGDE